ncbi:MAG: radical SAM protein, partial [Candidatus Wolfebacteria bacterium]|nr:radical SAM protein [Candidatus Wolfebacteria bacterium]
TLSLDVCSSDLLDFIKNNRRHICGITNLNTCNAPLGSELSRDCKKFELFFPVQGLLRDSRWQTQEGNTYALRTKRAKEALELAKQLEIPIFVSNVYAKMITEKSLSGARLTEECQREKKDILLVVCPVWGTEAPPLGVAYLYSYLKQKGLSPAAWDINIDMFNDLYTEAGLWKMQNYRLWNDKNLFESKILPLFDHKIDHYVKEICAQDIKIVGFSVNAGNSLFSIEMARRIKKEDPRKIIIFGGPHSKWFRNDIDHLEKYIDVYRGIYPGLVDIFVIGEGELALSRIIKCIKNNQKLDTVPGIIFYRDNKYVQSVGEGLVDVLDDIPFPDFTWTDSHKYAEKKTYILMSRGCIRRCAFCNDYFVSSKFRCRSAGNVFEEIKKRLQENKINNFEFCDVMLNADAQALGELCELIIKSGIKIKWTGQGAIKKDMTQDLLFKMKESGCSTITYGIETFSDKVLGLMNKPFSYEEIQRVLFETSNAKIEGYINIITGFPGETEVEFSQTVKRLKECSKFIRGISSLAPCLVTLGSSLQLNPEKYGIIHTEKDSYFNWHTKDGNNYALRKSRISKILFETSKLKLPVGIVNLYDDDNLDSKEGAVTEDTNTGLDFLLVNLPPWAQ